MAQGPRALLFRGIHPGLGSAGESWGGQLSASAGHRWCLCWEGGNSSSRRESRELTPCVHKPSPFLAPTLQIPVPSALGQCLGWAHSPEAPMEHGGAGKCPSELVCAGAGPGSPPAHPGNHRTSPWRCGCFVQQSSGCSHRCQGKTRSSGLWHSPRVHETAHFSLSSSLSSPSIMSALLDTLHPCCNGRGSLES